MSTVETVEEDIQRPGLRRRLAAAGCGVFAAGLRNVGHVAVCRLHRLGRCAGHHFGVAGKGVDVGGFRDVLALIVCWQIRQVHLIVDLADLFADLAVVLDLGGIDIALRVRHGRIGRAFFVDHGKVGAALRVGHVCLRVDLGLFAVEEEKPDRNAADHNDGKQTDQDSPDNLFHTRMPPVRDSFPVSVLMIRRDCAFGCAKV